MTLLAQLERSPSAPLPLKRRQPGRERLLAAARVCFRDHDYLTVSVEHIAEAAGVSRMTFYRHFQNKGELAETLFNQEFAAAFDVHLAITRADYRDPAVVRDWLYAVFRQDLASHRLLHAFNQALVETGGFTARAQQWIGQLITELGRVIPAFALDRAQPQDRRRWFEAWLLLYEILDMSNHVAVGTAFADSDMLIEILADRFVGFTASP